MAAAQERACRREGGRTARRQRLLRAAFDDGLPILHHAVIQRDVRSNQKRAGIVAQTAGRLKFDFKFSRIGDGRVGAMNGR